MMLGPSLAAVQSGSTLPAGARPGLVPASRNGRTPIIAGAGHPPIAAPPPRLPAEAGSQLTSSQEAGGRARAAPAWSRPGPAWRAGHAYAQENRGESHRVSGARQQCDLLEPGCPTTAEDCADHPCT
jgi:hypothetical protein